jgi:hypothetical protein
MPFCKKCGVPIEKPYRYCDPCNDKVAASQGQLMRRGRVLEKQLKEAADASGNAKIYTAAECDQDFLKSLIPKSF